MLIKYDDAALSDKQVKLIQKHFAPLMFVGGMCCMHRTFHSRKETILVQNEKIASPETFATNKVVERGRQFTRCTCMWGHSSIEVCSVVLHRRHAHSACHSRVFFFMLGTYSMRRAGSFRYYVSIETRRGQQSGINFVAGLGR